MAFRIKQCTSNWVAVGMCHKNIVVGKAYGFNFSSIGHGGYLISANGGSWSNSKIESNNCVKVPIYLFRPSNSSPMILSRSLSIIIPKRWHLKRKPKSISLTSQLSMEMLYIHVLCSITWMMRFNSFLITRNKLDKMIIFMPLTLFIW